MPCADALIQTSFSEDVVFHGDVVCHRLMHWAMVHYAIRKHKRSSPTNAPAANSSSSKSSASRTVADLPPPLVTK